MLSINLLLHFSRRLFILSLKFRDSFSRIAFTTTTESASRVILDERGAETLLGRGDMLYFPSDTSNLTRIHGAFVSDEEITAITGFLRICRQPQYQEDIFTEEEFPPIKIEREPDPLFDIVRKFVIETKSTSVSAIQRKFGIVFSRGAHIMDLLETEGVVSEPSKFGKRKLLLTEN